MDPTAKSSRSCEVVIVGAGPTGLLAAGLLARLGVAVRIVDKSPGAAKESRALVVQARTMEVFLSMGLDQAFLDKGLIVSELDVVVNGKPAVAVTFDDIGRTDTPFPFPLMIPQSETEAILAADVVSQGVTIEYGTDVTGFAQTEKGVSVTVLRGAEDATIEADYLVGTDGAHSIVRKTLGLSFEGAAYAQNFLLADCVVSWPFDASTLTLFLHGREFAAYFPLPGGVRGRVLAMDPTVDDPHASIDKQGSSAVDLSTVEAAMRSATQSDVALSDPIWTSRYRVHHRGVDRYRVGRVFVAGDAAHIHSPAGGQGMNTGLQDVANLAWKLAAAVKGGGRDALLDSYHGERWPVGRKVLERTDAMFSTMTSLGPLAAGLRNLALPLVAGPVMRSSTARAKAFGFISELGIKYRDGAFLVDEPAPVASPLRSGMRAPDARIARGRSVFDMLEGYRFTLLILSWHRLDADEISELSALIAALPATLCGIALSSHVIARSRVGRDERIIVAEDHAVFSAYGVGVALPKRVILVRPDGYIAYTAGDTDGAGLQAFLNGFTSTKPAGDAPGAA